MTHSIVHNWTEKSLIFVSKILPVFRLLPIKKALNNSILEVAQFSEASKAVLISDINDFSITITVSNDPSIIGKQVDPDFYNNYLKTQGIQLKKIRSGELKQFTLFGNAPYILAIPLEGMNFRSLLVLCFSKPPKDRKGLIVFAETVQTIFLEMMWSFKNITLELETLQKKDQNWEESNLLTSVLDSSNFGIMTFEAVRDINDEIVDFVCLKCNIVAKKLFQLSSDKLKEKNLIKILSTFKQSGLFEKFVNVVETQQVYETEHCFQKKGEITWIHSIAVKLNDGFVLTFSDISGRKKYEEKLIKNQSKLSAILENTSDLIWSMDREFRFTTMNSSLQNTVLQKSGKLLETGDILPLQMFSELFIPEGRKLFNRAFNGEQILKETEVYFKGAVVNYEFSFNPIKNKEGEVIEIAVFGHNITKRKHSEFEIRKKKQLLKAILENLPVLIFRIDADGYFTELKGNGLKNLGFESKKIIGKKAMEVFPDLDYNKLPTKENERNRRLFIKGEKDGKPWVFENYLFKDEACIGGIVGFGIDVTDQNQFEQELRKAKESSESANLAKSYFLANLSHEIRTPINSILGFAQLMKNQQLISESEEYLDYIITSGQILMNLLGNVLDLAKIEKGMLELFEEPFCFREVITSHIHPYKFKANEKGLKFNMSFDENIPEYLHGDAGKIIQIIINLLGNSLKFTKKGEIKISFSRISSSSEKITIRTSVSDTGIGVPKEMQNIIFKSYTQATPNIHKEFGGTGLGLAIVKELINLMDGELGVESPGELLAEGREIGSTFWFTLPLSYVNPPSIVPVNYSLNPEINYYGKLKVLLVDDNHLNQRLTSTMLNNIGCNVTIASNGKEAISKLANESFHLVFMDVQMPGLNGYETTDKIRKTLKSQVTIIGLSASVYKEDIERCFQYGMNDYLGRPYNKKSLYEKVIKWAPEMKITNDFPSLEISEPNEKLTKISFLRQIFNDDKQVIAEIIEIFIMNQKKMILKLGKAITKKDFKKIASISHNMRSSLQTVGLDSLNNILMNIEIIGLERKNEDMLQKYLMELDELNRKACLELEESLYSFKI